MFHNRTFACQFSSSFKRAVLLSRPVALALTLFSFHLLWPIDAPGQEVIVLPTTEEESLATEPVDGGKAGNTEENAVQSDARALSKAFRFAARNATPAVVTVFSYGQNTSKPAEPSGNEAENETENIPPGDEVLGPSPPQQSEGDGSPLTGLGSGVIVDLMLDTASETVPAKKGERTYWVITNHHVIADARRVVIQLPDESELVADKVHGDRDSDVAVLRIRSNSELATATLGNSDELEIGDWVLAIGSPFKLEATVCAGIISAKNRGITKIRRGRLFQTDAAINPGNSGGPLVDLNGHVIAINTAIATRNGGYQGIGFAIPVNQAKWIARELAQYERVRRAAMGVRLTELNPKMAKALDMPSYHGVVVYQVIKDSVADVAGLQVADVIVEFAGERVHKMSALQQAVEQQPVGSTQELKIIRDGKEIVKQIVLAPIEDPTTAQVDQE